MTRRAATTAALAAAVLLISTPAFAHCDALDGPVVKAATLALQNGDVTPVLRWISPDQEAELRGAFNEAREVRGAGPRAQALADRYFFETAVRLHRLSEGEPYAGLKPAGGIAVELVEGDRALETGTVDRLADALGSRIAETLRVRFKEALERRAHANESVDAGRRYVATYVALMHYVEEVGSLAAGGGAESHR